MNHNALVLTAELHRQHSLLHTSALQRQIGWHMSGNEGTVVIMIALALLVLLVVSSLIKSIGRSSS